MSMTGCVSCALLRTGASTRQTVLKARAVRPLRALYHTPMAVPGLQQRSPLNSIQSRAASTPSSSPSSREEQAMCRTTATQRVTGKVGPSSKHRGAPHAAHMSSRLLHEPASRSGEGTRATKGHGGPSSATSSAPPSSHRASNRATSTTRKGKQERTWYERFMTALLKPVFTHTIVSCRQCGNPISTARDFAFLRTEARKGQALTPERTMLAAPIEGTSLFVRRDQSKTYPHHGRCKHCFNFLGRVDTIPQLAAEDTQSSVIFPGIRLLLQPRRVRLSITSWVTGATHTLSCQRWCSLTPSEVFMTGLPLLHVPPEDSITGYDSAQTRQFALVRTSGGLYRWDVSDHSQLHTHDLHPTANDSSSNRTAAIGSSSDAGQQQAGAIGSGGPGTREIDFETDEYRDLVQRRYGAGRGRRGAGVGAGAGGGGDEGLFTKRGDARYVAPMQHEAVADGGAAGGAQGGGGRGPAKDMRPGNVDGTAGSAGAESRNQQKTAAHDDDDDDDDNDDDADADDELEKDLQSFEQRKPQQYATGLQHGPRRRQRQQQQQQQQRARSGTGSSPSLNRSATTGHIELEEGNADVHTRNLRPVERDLRLTGVMFGAKHVVARARARVVEALVNTASLFPKGSMLRVLLYHEAFVRPHWHPLGVKYSADFFREISATRDAPLSDQVVPLVYAAAAARWPLTREIDAPSVVLECLKYIFETKAEAPSTARARQYLQWHLQRLLDDVLHGAHAGRAMDVAEALAGYGFEIDEAAFTCIGLTAASMGEKGINPLLELTGLSLFDVSHCNHRPQYPALQRALATSKHISREHLQSKGLRWTLSLMLENDASARALTLLRTVEATGMDVQTGNETLIMKLVATSMEATSEDLVRALEACKTAGAVLQPTTLQLLSFAAPAKDGVTGNETPAHVGPAIAAVRDYLLWADSMGLIRLTKPAFARHAIRFFIGDHRMCENLAHAATNNCVQPFTLRMTYGALLATYLAEDDYERCLDVIHRIHAAEKRLNISLVHSSIVKRMVRVYVKLGMLQEAVHLVIDERTRQRTPMTKTTLTISYASILEYLFENDTSENEALGLELVRRAIKEGVYDNNLRFLDTGTLDLHDVSVGVARFLVLDFLSNMKPTRRRVTIITGKGLNSPNNIPVIKPMVETLLEERGYDFQNSGHNTGKLRVNLRSKKKAKSAGHALDRVLA